MKDSASNLAVSDTPPARGSLQLGDGGILGSSLAFAGVREKRHKFFFCEVWVEYGGYCSKDFCLARLPLSWPFGYRADFGGTLFICLGPFGVSGFPSSALQSLNYVR